MDHEKKKKKKKKKLAPPTDLAWPDVWHDAPSGSFLPWKIIKRGGSFLVSKTSQKRQFQSRKYSPKAEYRKAFSTWLRCLQHRINVEGEYFGKCCHLKQVRSKLSETFPANQQFWLKTRTQKVEKCQFCYLRKVLCSWGRFSSPLLAFPLPPTFFAWIGDLIRSVNRIRAPVSYTHLTLPTMAVV